MSNFWKRIKPWFFAESPIGSDRIENLDQGRERDRVRVGAGIKIKLGGPIHKAKKAIKGIGVRPWPEWLVDHIKQSEGLHDGDKTTPILEPQRDPVGLWTLGWGHLWSMDKNAKPPKPITYEQAERYLEIDMLDAAKAVMRNVKVPITDSQYAALVDFSFNVGEYNLKASTLLRMLNNGQYDEVPNQFRRWVYGAGSKVKLPGLVIRRDKCILMWKGKWPKGEKDA